MSEKGFWDAPVEVQLAIVLGIVFTVCFTHWVVFRYGGGNSE